MSVAALNVNLKFACRFDEVAGTAITDWKSGKVGTLTGGVLNQAGPGAAKSILFNGLTDYIEWLNAMLGTLINLGVGDGSFEIWQKTASAAIQFQWQKSLTGLDARTQASKRSSPGESGNTQAAITDGASASQVNDGGPWDDGVWHQLVFVIDRSGTNKVLLYKDAVLLPSGGLDSLAGIGAPDNAGSLLIGASALGGPSVFWDGYLTLPRIWTGRALTGSDVTELYNGGASLDIFMPPAPSNSGLALLFARRRRIR